MSDNPRLYDVSLKSLPKSALIRNPIVESLLFNKYFLNLSMLQAIQTACWNTN